MALIQHCVLLSCPVIGLRASFCIASKTSSFSYIIIFLLSLSVLVIGLHFLLIYVFVFISSGVNIGFVNLNHRSASDPLLIVKKTMPNNSHHVSNSDNIYHTIGPQV